MGRQVLTVALLALFAAWPLSASAQYFGALALLPPPGARTSTTTARSAPPGARPRLMAQVGHHRDVTALAFSGDGRLILTGSEDWTARLWEVATGAELRRLEGHTKEISSVALSFDGRLALTGSADGTARLWNASTGEVLRVIEGTSGGGWGASRVAGVALSKDGRLAMRMNTHSVGVWETSSGDLESEVQPCLSSDYGWVSSAGMSSDGRHLLAGCGNGTARLWDVRSRVEPRTLAAASEVTSVAFSDDSRLALTGEEDGTVQVWNVGDGSVVTSFQAHDRRIDAVAFSPDGRVFLTSGWDDLTRLWDSATTRISARKPLLEIEHTGIPAVFSPDGRFVLTATWPPGAQLWGASRGERIEPPFAGRTIKVAAISVSSTGDRLLVAGGGVARVWDLRFGQESRRLGQDVGCAAMSADARYVLTKEEKKGTAILWNPSDGLAVKRLDSPQARIYEGCVVALSPDGARALSANGSSACLFETESGRLVGCVDHEDAVTSAAFSPDGRQLLTGTENPGDKEALEPPSGTVHLWDVSTLREVWPAFQGHGDGVRSIAFSPDGRRAVTGDVVGTARLWDLETGRQVHLFEHFTGPQSSYDMTAFTVSVAFSPDGRSVVTSSHDGAARLWDASEGTLLREFRGTSPGLEAVAFAAAGRLLLTGHAEGTVTAWDVGTGELASDPVSLVSFMDGNWATIDAAGRFDGANGGDVDHLYWVVGLESIGLSQLKERYYEPGLLAKKLGFNPEPLRDVAAFEDPALTPDLRLSPPTPQDPVLHVDLTNRGGGIGRVVVLINGTEMTEDARPRGSDPGSAKLHVEFDLSRYDRWLRAGRTNEIEVRAYNAEGYLEGRGVEVVYEPPGEATLPEVTLWAVIVGVSDYAGNEIDLRYAAKDAEDMAKAVELGARRLFGATHLRLRVLASGRPAAEDQPTKANIAVAFAALTQATPDDIAFLYFSGHGVAVKDVYHFPTQEAHSTQLEDPEIRKQRSVSSEEIALWLRQSPIGKKVIILDTCAAGAAAATLARRRDVSADQVRALVRLRDRTGLHLLRGSAADRVKLRGHPVRAGAAHPCPPSRNEGRGATRGPVRGCESSVQLRRR